VGIYLAMTKNNDGGDSTPNEQKDPDEVLRGLSSENLQTNEEENEDLTQGQIEPATLELNCNNYNQQQNCGYEQQLLSQKFVSHDISFIIETLKKKAPHDGIAIRQLFYGMCSAFTKHPIPHNVNSKDTGAGKSYLLSHVGGYFPNRYVLPLTGMSDKAIFHRPGVMVIERYNEQTGEYEVVPIAPVINGLELQLEEIAEQINKGINKKENREKAKEIQTETKEINDRAEKLIDLSNQIILGLDTPSDSLFEALMALMSQDFPGDQKYEFAEKSSSGQMGRRINRLRGMPVLFTSRVIDDTKSVRFSEKNRRFINVNPVTSSEKIRTANCLIALAYGSLPEEYDKLVVSKQDSEKCKYLIDIVIAKLKHHSSYLKPKESGIIVPFHKAISICIPVSEDQPWSMTVTERTMKYLSIITKINMDNRPRIVDTETGQSWPIATFEDLKETLLLMERAASGVRPYLVNWFNDAFNPAVRDLNGKPNELKGDGGQVIIKEKYVGVNTDQLAEKTKKIYGGLKPSSGDVLTKYLYPLLNQGIIDKAPSEIDKRSNIYFPVEATIGGNNIFALFQDPDDIRLKTPSRDVYPTMNIIEDSIRFMLDCYYKEGVGNRQKYKIIDIDEKEITPQELAQKYFRSPQSCFIKDEETLTAERRAVCGNILYSKNVLHRVTPPACNNILSEFHNNHIEVKRITQADKNDTSDKSVTSDDSSRIITDSMNLTSRLELRHSPAAQVLTNDSLEDVEDGYIENINSSKSGGEWP
jgi:hypothetical protein